MPALTAPDRQLLQDALEAVVAAQPVSALRAGQVRLALEARLGAETSYRLRREVHRLVVALEEGVPTGLVRRLPLTETSLGRVARDLAESRGWTWQVASEAAELWAAALGSPLTAVMPEGAAETSSRPRPAAEVAGLSLDATMAPPGQADAAPQVAEVAPERPAGPVEWPPMRKTVRQAVAVLEGPPPVAGAHGAAGMSIALSSVLLTALVVVLCLPIFLWDARGGVLPLIGIALATPIAKRSRYGVLTAHEEGVRFTPYKPRTRAPINAEAVRAPWSQVRVKEGFITRVEWDGTSVQLLPRGRDVGRAMARAAAGASR